MKTRLAGDYIDARLDDVNTCARLLRGPTCGKQLEGTLHQSLHSLLRRELRRLEYHNPQHKYLPAGLHSEIGKWKAAADHSDLAPFVKQRGSQWCSAIRELLLRLEHDWAKLVSFFGLDARAKLITLSEPLGDLHQHGRSVYKLTFDDGSALIYKPRPVDGEYTFGKLIEWLGQNECEPRLAWCRALPRGLYGWSSYVSAVYCHTPDEAESYYERQGAFLALFFLIRGSDCIGENVIGHGEHPIWVDVECVCGPEFMHEEPLPVHVRPLGWVRRSVLSTSLMFHANHVRTPPRKHTALNVSCVQERSVVFSDDNIMRDRYIKAVQRGFRKLYASMLAHKTAWTAGGAAVTCWRNQIIRVIPRPTTLYTNLADLLCVAPQHLKDRARQTVEEILRTSPRKAPWLDLLVPAELRALERADVPYWSVATDSVELRESGGTALRGVVQRTGLESLIEHAAQMSEADLETQAWLIDSFLRIAAPVPPSG